MDALGHKSKASGQSRGNWQLQYSAAVCREQAAHLLCALVTPQGTWGSTKREENCFYGATGKRHSLGAVRSLDGQHVPLPAKFLPSLLTFWLLL